MDTRLRQPDLDGLYLRNAARLERIVRTCANVDDAVVEDACQLAWSQLARHCERVSSAGALAWLVRTAVREAQQLVRRRQIEIPVEFHDEALLGADGRRSGADPSLQAEWREQIAGLRALPDRQQRLLWLHALGLSYAEIAEHEGCTMRTVERQLLRARVAVRAALAT